MMSMEKFTSNVKEKLIDFYGKDAEITVDEILKYNNTKNTAVIIKFTDMQGIAPVIYLEGYFEMYSLGQDIDEVIEKITIQAEEARNVDAFDNVLSEIMYWEECKSKVYPVLVSIGRNVEMLENLVHTEILDLSAIYVIRVDSVDNSMATIKISKSLFAKWGISIDELKDTAIANMYNDNYSLFDMKSVLSGLIEEDISNNTEEQDNMFILTCESKMYGAAAVLNKEVMREITYNKDFYMIPSSVHEWILLPDVKHINPNEITSMIREVNKTLDSNEVLSDHAYYYSAENGL